MDNNIWIALAICALGTLLMRLLPLVWMQRHLAKRKAQEAVDEIPSWLSVFAPLMIAGMFGVSLVPSNTTSASWLATALGVIATLVVWRFTRSLGWPVFAGVLVYGVMILMA